MPISRFRRDWLPLPEQFWRAELAPRRLSRPSRGWARTTCPLHGRSNQTEFSVNLHSGGFCCFSCQAKGGSIIDYVMLRDRCGFKTAVQRLGAWDSTDYDATTRAERNRQCRERRQKQERFESAANKLAEMENSLRLDFCDQIHACDRILAEPGPHWTESQWQRAHAAQVLRDEYLLPVYTLLAWGSLRQRAEYVLADDRNRIELAAAVMRAGGVRDDNNRWREVLA